ncbi:MAG TPA: sigma-70 family RNA polymerase sigma factor [Sedimentisphaerales bacterium]|nr:sigma-70 family RNA polymerase sigma factor [Sedimentisphaerales bacterium]
MEPKDIAEILAACRAGRPEGYERLLAAYSTRIYGYFLRLTGDASLSDDLLSDLFVKLVERLDSYNGGSFEKWIFTIASNVFYDHLRRRQRQQRLKETVRQRLEKTGEVVDDADPFTGDDLQMHLASIDEETRELIILRFYGDLSFKEVAAMKQMPVGTILSKVHRGLRKLREQMKEQ